MRVGMIGAGGIARRHAETLERAGEQLIAVCDVDPGAREALARAWGAAAYADGLELLARERLDAVVVATPPAAHREIAVAALERGLAVYLEKPLARTLEDAQAIVEAAERTGAVCAVGYQWRAIGWLDGLRERLASERVGLLAGRIHGAARPRSWFVDRAQGGGQVLERASHLIDLERALGGEVVRVQALGSSIDLAGVGRGGVGDIEDVVALQLGLASGGLALCHVAWTPPGQPATSQVDVVTDAGELTLRLDPELRLQGLLRGEPVEAQDGVDAIERSLRRLLAAARSGDAAAVGCTPREALGSLAVALACEEALASGATVGVRQV